MVLVSEWWVDSDTRVWLSWETFLLTVPCRCFSGHSWALACWHSARWRGINRPKKKKKKKKWQPCSQVQVIILEYLSTVRVLKYLSNRCSLGCAQQCNEVPEYTPRLTSEYLNIRTPCFFIIFLNFFDFFWFFLPPPYHWSCIPKRMQFYFELQPWYLQCKELHVLDIGCEGSL